MAIMLKGEGFEVVDLVEDVEPGKFVDIKVSSIFPHSLHQQTK
jgi:hypothetical protein